MDFSLLNENSFWVVPLVVAVVESFKMSGFNHKFAPMISLAIGLGLSFVVNASFDMAEIIVAGVIYGLSASGLYSSVKSTANIRGRVPLRTNKEAVQVETFEVEKPLQNGDGSIKQEQKNTLQSSSNNENQNRP